MTVSTVVPGGTLPLLPTCSRQHNLVLYHTPACQWFPSHSPDQLCYCRTVWCGVSSAPPQTWYRVCIHHSTSCKQLEWKQLPYILPNSQREDYAIVLWIWLLFITGHTHFLELSFADPVTKEQDSQWLWVSTLTPVVELPKQPLHHVTQLFNIHNLLNWDN